MGQKTFGLMAVDREQRVDFDRLRTERLARVKKLLSQSEMGALLCFDMNNIRYVTATHIGTWAMDKLVRFSLLPQNDDPILWDFGFRSAPPSDVLSPGWQTDDLLPASQPCGALCRPKPGGPRTWPEKSKWLSKNEASKTSLSALTWSSCLSCSPCRRKASTSSPVSSSCKMPA